MASISRDSLLRVYRRYAPIYDLAFGRALEAGRHALAESLRPHQPRTLLEVGVGTGLVLHHYPREAFVCGVDLSREMLSRARSLVGDPGMTHVSLICADAEQLPFPDNSFECVTLPYVLSVTPDPAALLCELRRVCKPGGHIFVLNHFQGAGVWRWTERLLAPLAHRVGFSSTLRLIETLASPDWSMVSIKSVNLLGLSKLVVLRNRDA